jgi:hypothetical protein
VAVLVRRVSTEDLVRHAPLAIMSLVIAELFYKFGSFTLELLAFFATWLVADALRGFVIRVGRGSANSES